MHNASLCQQYLNLVYHDAQVLSREHNHSISETYGEILYPSMENLISTLSLSKQDVFVDLGSGLGKIVLYVFLRTLVKEAHGIEIIPGLHHQALAAAQRVYRELPDFYVGDRKLIFTVGDFLENSLTEASVLLIGSPCFSPTMSYKMGEMINQSKRIHTVLTLRPILNLKNLSFKKVIRIEGSWDTALCYIYTV